MKITKAKIYSNLIITFNDKKRVVYSFISNNDGTRGFRFNVLGLKGFTRFRKGWKKHQQSKNNSWLNSYKQFHFSFITIAFEKRSNPIKLSKTFAKVRS
jgi:hypothetical protein